MVEGLRLDREASSRDAQGASRRRRGRRTPRRSGEASDSRCDVQGGQGGRQGEGSGGDGAQAGVTAAGAPPSLDPNSLARVPDPSTHVGAALSIGNSTLGNPKHAGLRSVADVAGSARRVGNVRTRSAAEPAHILGFSRPSSSFADVITRMRRSLGNSPLGVFLHGYLDLKSTAPTSELELTTGHASPFPMPVPFRDDCEAPHPRGLRRGLYQRRLARHCVNVLIGYFSYVELGCPRGCPFNASGPLSEVQRIAAENLEGEIVRFLRHDRGLSPSTFAGGRARLVGHLASLTYAAPGFKAPDLATTVALPVEPLRVALPHTAGTIDPARVLPEPYRRACVNWEKEVRLHHSEWASPLPRSCHTLPKELELDFIRELLRRGMGILVAAEDLPLDPSTGLPVTSGFFCVCHKEFKDRLIQDRRCSNETERALEFLSLPSGPQFTLMFLGEGETLRGSADDFSTYFYSIRPPLGSERWNATGRPWSGHLFTNEELGDLSPDGTCYFSSTVMGMGGKNSMDVAQAVHEAMLEQAGCMRPHERMDHKRPPPMGRTWEGTYADDHVVVQRLTVEELRSEAVLRDNKITDASVESYLRHGAVLELDKRIRFRENFVAWGTQVRGRRGLVESSLDKRFQIAVLVFQFVCLRVADVGILDRVLGSLVHPLQHRTELSSVLHRVCKWKSGLYPGKVYKVPGDIRDELSIATLFVALCDINIRAPVEKVIRTTDATPSGFGATVAPCPPRVL